MTKWKIAIDTGGTFTDCYASGPDGVPVRFKVLSSGKLRGVVKGLAQGSLLSVDQNWALSKDILAGYSFSRLTGPSDAATVLAFDPVQSILTLDRKIHDCQPGDEFELDAGEEAPVLAMRMITGTSLSDTFPEIDLRLGTTKGTNALLEHKGSPSLLITTTGFADLPLIGDQQRPDLFALQIHKSKPLLNHVIEVDERIDCNGNIIKELTESEINRVLRKVFRLRPEVIAIALMNSFSNPVHENNLANILRTAGYKHVSVSSGLEKVIKFFPRMQTTLVNAYLLPMMNRYLDNIRECLGDRGQFSVMTSSGGLVSISKFHPKDSLLSGPAGGVAGAATIARKLSLDSILAFDMGGTSTDVSRYAGEFDYVYETRVSDQQILSPSLYIETVAAGGGSVCAWDGLKLTVGPESAGADPGPACYAKGGPLTITDVNLLLGRMNPSHFGIPISRKAAEEQFVQLHTIDTSLSNIDSKDILRGLLHIANEKMARAIERISLQKGYEPSRHSLLAFGGAGGMHACAIADILGIEKIVIPYDAGILSASGIRSSCVEQIITRQILRPLNELDGKLAGLFNEMKEEGIALMATDGISREDARVHRTLVLARLKGQNDCLELPFSDENALPEMFEKAYLKRYGHYIPGRIIEIESLRLVVGEAIEPVKPLPWHDRYHEAKAVDFQLSLVDDEWVDTGIYHVDSLNPYAEIKGPALVLFETGSAYIEKNWIATLNADRDVIVRRVEKKDQKPAASESSQPRQVQLELFTNRFKSVAEDMGALLQRTSFSVNVKERLDFSCALLDAEGYLVVNAPHIPVHLGAMGICTRELISNFSIREGDILITNHPAFGGSHLPDVTLVAPVFYNGKRVAFVANRAHHAEIGGISPGSMPANARNLEEEGVVISPQFLARSGKFDYSNILDLLHHARYPSRNPEENLADLEAGVASILKGIEKVQDLCTKFDPEQVAFYMNALAAYSGTAIENKLNELFHEPLHAKELLDDGSILQVNMTRKNENLILDFTGTSSPHPVNMNATPAIVQSVLLYVFRILVDENIPLNEGLLRNVSVIMPECLLNPTFSENPEECPAVVGGNVEVSQRLTDTLLKAFNIAACSQGTMNNLLFGNENFGFYETICGGVGAVEGENGASGVHQHMTNTRITDPEIMELRYPVRIEEFSLRKGSGGAGKWSGGDGVVRKLTFLEAVRITLLAQHRVVAPYGIRGGKPGKCGEQFLQKNTGKMIALEGIDSIDAEAGDMIIIKTPGGGGYGSPEPAS